MFFAALDRLRRGVARLRIRRDRSHPAHVLAVPRPGTPGGTRAAAPEHQDAIRTLYQSNDALVGEILDRLQQDDVLMVMSDHGFSSFRRGVNLNAWLQREGYLTLAHGSDGAAEWLRGVDWSRTKAYCLGLAGMFVNLRGRERSGIVEPGAAADALKAEIAAKLKGLVDPGNGRDRDS